MKSDVIDYDLIVIGSGAGLNVASNAYGQGMKVAIVEEGPLGGTCLNRGCVPSKILLYPAEVVATIQHADRVGVHVSGVKVDFEHIMKRMHALVDKDVAGMTKGIKGAKGFDLYRTVGRFVGPKTLDVGGKRIRAPKVLIAAGSREYIPPIEGLEGTGYITSTTALELKKQPKSMVIIGGGYIAAEFGHFFSAMGTDVTILGRNDHFVPSEEPEVSKELKDRLSERLKVLTGVEAIKVGKRLMKKTVTVREKKTGKERTFSADEIMLAVGRISNADMFHPEATGVRTDPKGWIVVDEYLRTNVEGIWAIGDALGKHMFRHTANSQSDIVWNNMTAEKVEDMEPFDESAIPHAIFTYPEVASVGMKEAEAVRDHLVLVGETRYTDTVKGYAMDEPTSFLKVIIDARTRRILGAHAIGPHATALIHPVIYLMNSGDGTYLPLAKAQTIHPSMEEVLTWSFGNFRPGKGQEKRFGHHHHHHDHDHDHEHDHDHAEHSH